jgi:hypothetical protein
MKRNLGIVEWIMLNADAVYQKKWLFVKNSGMIGDV